MNCVFCGKGLRDGYTLHRISPKGAGTGKTALWACDKHVKNTDVRIDPGVAKVLRAINPRSP